MGRSPHWLFGYCDESVFLLVPKSEKAKAEISEVIGKAEENGCKLAAIVQNIGRSSRGLLLLQSPKPNPSHGPRPANAHEQK